MIDAFDGINPSREPEQNITVEAIAVLDKRIRSLDKRLLWILWMAAITLGLFIHKFSL
jgi:hypothetical protein